MSLIFIVNPLLHLNWLLKLGSHEFEKMDSILSRGVLSLKGLRELKDRLKWTGEGFEVVDYILRDNIRNYSNHFQSAKSNLKQPEGHRCMLLKAKCPLLTRSGSVSTQV